MMIMDDYEWVYFGGFLIMNIRYKLGLIIVIFVLLLLFL